MRILADGYCVIRSMFYNTLIKYPDHLYSLFDNYNITEATFNHFNNLLKYNGNLLYANYESFKDTKLQILNFISKFRGAKNYNIFEKLEKDDKFKNYLGDLLVEIMGSNIEQEVIDEVGTSDTEKSGL